MGTAVGVVAKEVVVFANLLRYAAVLVLGVVVILVVIRMVRRLADDASQNKPKNKS